MIRACPTGETYAAQQDHHLPNFTTTSRITHPSGVLSLKLCPIPSASLRNHTFLVTGRQRQHRASTQPRNAQRSESRTHGRSGVPARWRWVRCPAHLDACGARNPCPARSPGDGRAPASAPAEQAGTEQEWGAGQAPGFAGEGPGVGDNPETRIEEGAI